MRKLAVCYFVFKRLCCQKVHTPMWRVFVPFAALLARVPRCHILYRHRMARGSRGRVLCYPPPISIMFLGRVCLGDGNHPFAVKW